VLVVKAVLVLMVTMVEVMKVVLVATMMKMVEVVLVLTGGGSAVGFCWRWCWC
jgi:hypothetical protein